MSSTRGSRVPGERGFSLLEMMIALVIMGVITSQMFVVLSTQKRQYTGGSRDNDLQESARLISDLLSFDARNAGMMIPREAAIASFDGGLGGPDRICMSDTSFFQIPAAGTQDAYWDRVGQRLLGPDATVGASRDSVTVSDLNVDGHGFTNDWNPRAATDPQPTIGIIVARRDGRASYCGQIASLNAATRTFTLRTADVPTTALTGSLVAVPAIVYELRDQTTGDGDRSTLYRNGVAISTQVEDLQIEFGIDSTGGAGVADGRLDSNGEFPIHNLAPSPVLPTVAQLPSTSTSDSPDTALSRIRRVRISVLSRATLADETGNRIVRHSRPALGNRTAGTARDAFARRVYTVSVMPRNMLKPGELATDVP